MKKTLLIVLIMALSGSVMAQVAWHVAERDAGQGYKFCVYQAEDGGEHVRRVRASRPCQHQINVPD